MDRVEIFYQLFATPAQAHALEPAMLAAALAFARQADPAVSCSARQLRRANDRHSSLRSRLFQLRDDAGALVQQWEREHPGEPIAERAVYTVAATLNGNGIAARRDDMYWAVLGTVAPQARVATTRMVPGHQEIEDIPWAGGVYVVAGDEHGERLMATV